MTARGRDAAAGAAAAALSLGVSELAAGLLGLASLIEAVGDDTVTIKLPDAPKDTNPNHVLPLASIAEAKLVMTDKLLNMAKADQDENPIDDDEDIETVELTDIEEKN